MSCIWLPIFLAQIPSPERVIDKAAEAGWMAASVAFLFVVLVVGVSWMVKREWERNAALDNFIRTTLYRTTQRYGILTSQLLRALRDRPCLFRDRELKELLEKEVAENDDADQQHPG